MKNILILFLFFPFFSFAQSKLTDNPIVEKETKIKRIKVYGISELMSASNSTTQSTYSGYSLGVLGNYALTSNFAVGVGLQQSFQGFGQGASATIVDFRLTWSLTGKLLLEESKVKLEGYQAVSTSDVEQNGWRIQGIVSQYNFNGTNNSIPYSGVGVAGFYEFNTNKIKNVITGMKFESIVNGDTKITPISIFFGVGWWF
jgi:hypothetical protein